MTILGFVISEHISSIIGFLYPAYKSFKALQTPTEIDDQQWLTYWTVFGLLYMVEYFVKPILYYVPLYYELKILVLIWLSFPVHSKAGGAQMLFVAVVKPFLESREHVFDHWFGLVVPEEEKESTKEEVPEEEVVQEAEVENSANEKSEQVAEKESAATKEEVVSEEEVENSTNENKDE